MEAEELGALKADMKSLSTNLVKVEKAVVRMETIANHSENSCPYRVQIARNENGVKEARQDANEALHLAQNNKVKIAQFALSSGLGGTIVLIGQAILSAIK